MLKKFRPLVGTSVNSFASDFQRKSEVLLVPLGVEINPQFYWGKVKSFSMRKTSMI